MRQKAIVAIVAVAVAAFGIVLAARSFLPARKVSPPSAIGARANGKIAFLAGKGPGSVIGGDSHLSVMDPDELGSYSDGPGNVHLTETSN